MKTALIAATLVASILATAVSASANPYYLEPGSRLDGQKLFNSLPTGQ